MWSWRGAVALVLATCVGIGWAVALVIAVLNPEHLSRSGRLLLYALGVMVLGGLLGWLASGRDKGRDDDERPSAGPSA